MKKKLIVGLLTGAVLLGGAGVTFAASNGNGEEPLNFGQMLPFMQQMHPDYSTKELKQMYDSCHGANGVTQNTSANNMMNNF